MFLKPSFTDVDYEIGGARRTGVPMNAETPALTFLFAAVVVLMMIGMATS